ncbi:hypothetical protein [Streptomyces lydicus]|uniref:hypothetical protein n=1 Tax=Streptomyces lydicus TaxID=47763 RepID=UPI00370128EE
MAGPRHRDRTTTDLIWSPTGGVMAQGHTAGRAVATAAAILQDAFELPEDHRDAYWAMVAYHHSLSELGRTVRDAADDIPA